MKDWQSQVLNQRRGGVGAAPTVFYDDSKQPLCCGLADFVEQTKKRLQASHMARPIRKTSTLPIRESSPLQDQENRWLPKPRLDISLKDLFNG
jgi:hypothetical protein